MSLDVKNLAASRAFVKCEKCKIIALSANVAKTQILGELE